MQLEAIIAIEDSLSRRLVAAWKKEAPKYRKRVADLMEVGDVMAAQAVANDIDMTPIYAAAENYIRTQTYAAMLHGAGRVTGSVKGTTVSTGVYESLVQAALRQFKTQIMTAAKDAARKELLKLIAQAHEGTDPEPTTAKKIASLFNLSKVLKIPDPKPVFKAERVVRDFVSFDKAGDEMLQLISQLHTSRLSAYGFTAEAEVVGMRRYAINEQLDVRICPVCREMHGKTFEVRDARRLLDTILREENPEAVKSLQPWPSQRKDEVEAMTNMSSDELVSRGWHIPPYHPGCRGLLVPAGTVPALPLPTSSGSVTEASSTAVASEILHALNTKPTTLSSQAQIKDWLEVAYLLPMTNELEDAINEVRTLLID